MEPTAFGGSSRADPFYRPAVLGLGVPVSDRVLLLAHPRSGSSNLYQILQAHPELDILEEPFNENYTSWRADNKDYRAMVKDVASLDTTLGEILEHWNGLKVLDYQLAEEWLEHLVARDDFRVVSIRRRNLLQAAVSGLIAEHTTLWKVWDAERPIDSYYQGFEPFDLDLVRRRMDLIADSHALYERLRRRCEGRWWSVVYEDLFFAAVREQETVLSSLWEFLGLDPVPVEELDYYLRPERTKMNSPATYRLVPNIEEVETMCGSDERGWLFTESPAGVPVELGDGAACGAVTGGGNGWRRRGARRFIAWVVGRTTGMTVGQHQGP